MEQALWQGKAPLGNCKVGQELLLSGTNNLLKSGAVPTTKWSRYLKEGATLLQCGQILQSGVVITKKGST